MKHIWTCKQCNITYDFEPTKCVNGCTISFKKIAVEDERKPPCLPGSMLQKIIRKLGARESVKCGCQSLKARMDKWGCDECEERIDEIVKYLGENSKKVMWVSFPKWSLKRLVMVAIRLARREQRRNVSAAR